MKGRGKREKSTQQNIFARMRRQDKGLLESDIGVAGEKVTDCGVHSDFRP
jgi:hypothetical protein